MIEILRSNPLLLLFVVAALGYPLGRITVRGTSLGVAAVLFDEFHERSVHADLGLALALQLGQVELLPVIPDPSLIACIGHNYEAHRIETGREVVGNPSVFLRIPDSLQGADQPLLMPRESDRFDYEGELAIVIGKGGRRIPEAEAWDHVFGVSCFNDGSVRDYQRHTAQFIPGKNFPLTGSFGPALVTLDELPADRVVELTTRLNGEVMQNAKTDQLIFPIPRLIAYISTWATLRPGDVIVTGTPGGVGDKHNPQRFMKDGEVVEVEISSVGLLRNVVKKEA